MPTQVTIFLSGTGIMCSSKEKLEILFFVIRCDGEQKGPHKL